MPASCRVRYRSSSQEGLAALSTSEKAAVGERLRSVRTDPRGGRALPGKGGLVWYEVLVEGDEIEGAWIAVEDGTGGDTRTIARRQIRVVYEYTEEAHGFMSRKQTCFIVVTAVEEVEDGSVAANDARIRQAKDLETPGDLDLSGIQNA